MLCCTSYLMDELLYLFFEKDFLNDDFISEALFPSNSFKGSGILDLLNKNLTNALNRFLTIFFLSILLISSSSSTS